MDPLETFEPDACCGRRIMKASLEGKLAGKTEWTCPQCGETWRKGLRLVEHGGTIEVYHWQIVPLVAILK